MKTKQMTIEQRAWLLRHFGAFPNMAMFLAKLMEEVGELGAAYFRGDQAKLEDAVGDTIIVVRSVAIALGVDPDKAVAKAWAEVKGRSEARVQNREEPCTTG